MAGCARDGERAMRCKKCGAVVSARRMNGDVETSYGADFRAKCRELADRLGGDFVSTAIECSYMAEFIERSAFRITEVAGDRLETGRPKPAATQVKIDDAVLLESA